MNVNTELREFIVNNDRILVNGLEGSGKSRDVLHCLLYGDLVDYETKYVIYAMSSYERLYERQQELMKYHGLTEAEVPVVQLAHSVDDSNKKYITELDSYDNAKILLVTHSAIKRCMHLDYNLMPYMVNGKGEFRQYYAIVFDEFDFASCIIPRLDYIQESITWGSRSKTTCEKYVKSNYSIRDWLSLKGGDWSVAYYIRHNGDYSKSSPDVKINEKNWRKTIFVSSEDMAGIILESIRFNTIRIKSNDYKHHTINYKSDLVNTHTFDRLNDYNKWGIFGFKTIISDRYNRDYQLEHVVEEFKVINHMQCKGSNLYQGVDELLTIISHVPNVVVKAMWDAINSLYSHEEYTIDKIRAIYYKDRLMQAVGRVLGYRGEQHDVNNAWTLISNTIMDGIIKYIDDGSITIPYTLKEWNINNPEWDAIVKAVTEDRRISNEDIKQQKLAYKQKYRKNIKRRARQIIQNDFTIGQDTDVITVKELKDYCKNKGLTGITATFIAAEFGLKPYVRYYKGKNKACVVGLKRNV